jgi:quercetin dioxygenase-like cupin family protein
MLRKAYVGAALLALCLLALALYAQNPGLKRTMLQKSEFPGDKYATITALAEVAPGVSAGRHTHPGVESGYVVDGEAILMVEGQPDRPLKAGDSFLIPPGVPHDARNTSSDKPVKVVSTYVVEKDKPLATPAPK